ncbi:MAG: epimerase, partial [Thermoplasmata archaeon]|nr:epimerase [Thermoplasmata archaeon]
GVLRECLLSPDVRRVVSVGRSRLGEPSEKLEEVVIPDLTDLSALTDRIPQFDAAFFCVGVSALGMTESTYAHLTLDLTMAVAEPLARRNPTMTFVYVSGAGTDSTERGRSMWARVKG